MGAGKTKVDSRWRITLQASARGNLRPGDEVLVEERGNVIVIRKAVDPLKVFREVKLCVGDEKLRAVGADQAKHVYGAVKE